MGWGGRKRMRPCCHCLLITQIAIEYAKQSKAQHEKRMRNEVEKEAKAAVAAQEC